MKTTMDFQWNEDLIKEMIWSKIPIPDRYIGNIQKCLDEFKRSKELEGKDYEILECKGNNIIHPYQPNACLGADSTVISCEIYSVKRLSDGQIFTLGDMVCETITGTSGVWVINEFSLKDTRCFSCGVNIMNLEKPKEVLFYTEDGIGIHEGDTYYTLEPNNNWLLYYSGAAGNGSGKSTIAKYFSTKESAEDWKMRNKPIFSLNDIEKIKNEKGCLGDSLLEELRQLAKSINDR